MFYVPCSMSGEDGKPFKGCASMNAPLKISLILCSLFAAGATLRVSGLDRKFYWIDEVSSSFVITGNWPSRIDAELEKQTGKIIRVASVLEILESPNAAGTVDLLRSLAKDDPHHCPFYFLLLQKWAVVFGAKPGILRLPSALFGALSILAFAWLSAELFSSWRVATVGAGILTIAPFHILYSQQNREYSLWFLMMTLSTAMLLTANRTHKRRWWTAYGVAVALSLYTFLFSVTLVVSHALFQWARDTESKNREFRRFAFAASTAIACFSPWLLVIASQAERVDELNQWSAKSIALPIYLQSFALNVSRLFVDLNLPSMTSLPWQRPDVVGVVMLSFLLAIVSVAHAVRRLSRSRGVLLASLFIVPILFLVCMDVGSGGGIRALIGRYLMSSWIAVYLSVSFCVAAGLRSKDRLQRWMAIGAGSFLLFSGVHFSTNYLPQVNWWPLKPTALANATTLLNTSNAEIVILSDPIPTKQFIAMAYSLSPNLPMMIVKDHDRTPDLSHFRRVALYKPSQWLVTQLQADYEFRNPAADALWIGERRES